MILVVVFIGVVLLFAPWVLEPFTRGEGGEE